MTHGKLSRLLVSVTALALLLQPAQALAETAADSITMPASQGLWTSQVLEFTVTGGDYWWSVDAVPGLPDGMIVIHSESSGNDVWVHEPTYANWTGGGRLNLPAGTYTIHLMPNVWRNYTITGPGIQFSGEAPTLVLTQRPFVTANESITFGAAGTLIARDVPVIYTGPSGEHEEVYRNADQTVDPVTFSTAALADGIYFASASAMGGNGQFTGVALPLLVDRVDTFRDLPKGHWARKYVEVGYHLGLIAESPAGTFRPDERITRGEFGKILAESFGLKSNAEPHFFADSVGHWSEPWINALYENGIALGTVSGGRRNFNPDQLISRQEAATLVARAYRLSPFQGALAFPDKGKIGAWAVPSVGALVQQGWMGGYVDGTFRPEGQLLRSEAIRILASPLGL